MCLFIALQMLWAAGKAGTMSERMQNSYIQNISISEVTVMINSDSFRQPVQWWDRKADSACLINASYLAFYSSLWIIE